MFSAISKGLESSCCRQLMVLCCNIANRCCDRKTVLVPRLLHSVMGSSCLLKESQMLIALACCLGVLPCFIGHKAGTYLRTLKKKLELLCHLIRPPLDNKAYSTWLLQFRSEKKDHCSWSSKCCTCGGGHFPNYVQVCLSGDSGKNVKRTT